MQLARVIGHATATVKHASLNRWRMMVAQPLNPRREAESDCLLVVDNMGAAPGQLVILNSDGKAARELMGDPKSPVRWFVIGLIEE